MCGPIENNGGVGADDVGMKDEVTWNPVNRVRCTVVQHYSPYLPHYSDPCLFNEV